MPAARTEDELSLISASMWVVGHNRGLLDSKRV